MRKIVIVMVLGAMLSAPVCAADKRPSPASQRASAQTSDPEPDWRWDAMITGWDGSCSGARLLDTPELADRRARELKEAGITAACMNGLHFRHNFLAENERIKRNARLAVEACHKYGLKVIEHHDVTLISAPAYDYLVDHLDWLQKDIRTGIPCRSFCISNPQFLQHYIDYLVDFQKATGVDGYMLDEVGFFYNWYCGCDSCRSQFTNDTGLVLPVSVDSPVWHDSGDPLWQTWCRWQTKKTGDFFVPLKEALRKINPHVSLLGYSSVADQGPFLVRMLQETARARDFLGNEVVSRCVFTGWPGIFLDMKLRSGIADHHGHPHWDLLYAMNKDAFFFSWAMARMNRHAIWRSSEHLDIAKEYIAWPHQMKNQYARTLSDVGVLFSTQTRDSNPSNPFHRDEWGGWCEVLIRNNIQFDVLMDGDVNADRLSKYRVLLLPNAAALSKEQVAAVTECAKGGGTVIATYLTSRHSETGDALNDFALGPAMNIRFKGTIPSPNRIDLRPGLVDTAAILHGPAPPAVISHRGPQALVAIRDPHRSKVLAEVADAGGRTRHAPAVLTTPYGKGRFLYIAGKFGVVNYEPQVYPGRVWDYPITPEITNIMRNAVYWAAGGLLRIEPVRVPEGVICTAYEQTYGGAKEVIIHLLNCSGRTMTPGQKVTLLKEIPYPDVPGEIILKVRVPEISEAFVASPLPNEKRSLTFSKDDDGYRVIIPPGFLKRYAVVHLREGVAAKKARRINKEIKPDRKQVKCKWTGAPPVLDGVLNDACWQNADIMTGFSLYDVSPCTPATPQTRVKLLYDQGGLYIGIRCDEVSSKHIKARVTDRDGPVWDESSIEMFLDIGNVGKKGPSICQIIVNARGAVYDQYMNSGRWDGQYTVKTAIDEKGWNIEMQIPWFNFDLAPQEGEVWGVNVGRDHPRPISSWVHIDGRGLMRPELFGQMVFVR